MVPVGYGHNVAAEIQVLNVYDEIRGLILIPAATILLALVLMALMESSDVNQKCW